MPTNEEGEFELVLGNKQLLSVFFLVVLLLGVFFSMGYIVGRNTAPAATQMAGLKQPPLMVEPGAGASPASGSSGAGLPDPTKPSPSQPPPPKTTAQPPATTAQVKPEPPKPEPPKPEPVKAQPPKPAPVKPEPVKVTLPKPEPPKPLPPAPTGGALKGTYLQVAATKLPDVPVLVNALRGKGFATATSPVPDSPLVRVLVGPLADAGAISSTREALNAAGFKPIVRKF